MGLYEYLHEFDAYDSLTITLESIQEVVAYVNYQERQSERASDISMLFEGADPEEVKAAVNKNIFEKIGSKIRLLIEKIKEFGQWIADKIAEIIPGMKSDAEKANQILKDNPDLRDQIILAYREGDMTLKDIAGLEKDVEAVMRLYEAGKIDEDTASGKIKTAIDKFNKSGETILKTAGTVAGLLTIVGVFTAAVVKMRKSNKEFQEIIESYHRSLEKIRTKNPSGSKVGSVLSALSQALGFSSEEVKNKISMSQKIRNALGKFVRGSKASANKNAGSSLQDAMNRTIDEKKDALKKATSPDSKEKLKKELSLAKTLKSFVDRTGELPNVGAAGYSTDVNKNINTVLGQMEHMGKTPSEIRDETREQAAANRKAEVKRNAEKSGNSGNEKS